MGKHLVQKENKAVKSKADEIEYIDFEIDDTKQNIKKENFQPNGSVYIASVVSAILIVVIPFLKLESWMNLAAYGVAFLLAALELIWELMDNIQDKKYFALENITLLAAVTAFGSGAEFEAVLLLLAFTVTKLALDKLKRESLESLKKFTDINIEYADVITAEGVLRVNVECINPGDVILVNAGETIALDGIIVDGISTIDTSMFSGHTNPWAVNEGHRVYSGCKNITSPIKVKVSRNSVDSTADCIIRLTEAAPQYLSRQEKLCLKLQKYISPAMLLASVLLTLTISLLNGQWQKNLESMSCLLTVACFTLILSAINMCYARAAGKTLENGIFVKGADCIESMAKSETLVFDKTGIITEGRYIITDVYPNKVSEHELLSMAATAERFSRHPIATVLREAAGQIEIDYKSLQIEEIPGRGVSAFVGEKQVYVGNTALLEEHGIKCAVPVRPGAAIHVAVDYKYWGHILVTDRIRRGAFDALENLRAQGVKKMVLLTGDVLSVAKPLASKLNFDMLRAELKPSEKVSAVDFLMSNRGETTALAFVGDGNSDEQIMGKVDVSIALGSLGSDAAINASDVLIMDRDIKKIPLAFKISRSAYHVAMINILLWFVVSSIITVLGALGILPLLIAIIAEFIMAFAILINTRRIK